MRLSILGWFSVALTLNIYASAEGVAHGFILAEQKQDFVVKGNPC